MKTKIIVTTGFSVPGYPIGQTLGIVQGLVVRAVNFGDRIAGAITGLGGGNVRQYEDVCIEARREAYQRMIEDAEAIGADAIIGMRYDAVEIGKSMSEVIAYGTGVKLEFPKVREVKAVE